MTKLLEKAISRVHNLPAPEQDKIAVVIDQLVTETAVEQGMQDIQNGNVRDASTVFSDFKDQLKAKHGTV